MSWRELEPRASRLWVRFAPRRWPATSRPYIDLAERRIAWPPAGTPVPGVELPPNPSPGDVALLPPVEKALTREKQDLVAAVALGGVAMDQRVSEFEFEAEAVSAVSVADLLFSLFENNFAEVDRLAAGAVALVPLLPVLSDDEAVWRSLFERLSVHSLAAVVGVAPELSPVDRRRLVERLGDGSFERVHHHGVTAGELERRFARAVAAAGLNPFFERPEVTLAPRAARNRRIAAVLFEAGERWLALGRNEADGASLLAAARHVESATQEIEALARERQLALLPFLSPLAREAVAAFADNGRSALLAELRAEWVGARVHA